MDYQYGAIKLLSMSISLRISCFLSYPLGPTPSKTTSPRVHNQADNPRVHNRRRPTTTARLVPLRRNDSMPLRSDKRVSSVVSFELLA